MNLLVGFYQDPHPARGAELLSCLMRNIENRHISQVHVFLESNGDSWSHAPFDDAKVRTIRHGRRVTYQALFEYARRELAGSRVIVANSDIHFDDTLALLHDHDLAGKLFCLSRWDVQRDGTSQLFEFPFSQDAWIFESPLPDFSCDWHLGKPGCENRLAYEAERAGLRLSNPSRSVRAHHLHLSGVRRYSERDRLAGMSRPIEATYLEPLPAVKRRPAGAGAGERTFALTSFPPRLCGSELQNAEVCLSSWRAAGLEVRSFNHPAEVEPLAKLFPDLEIVPVLDTTERIFERPLIPISTMLRWAAREDTSVLLLNADIELRIAPWELKRARWIADGGLCYLVRHNHDGDVRNAVREPYGIDGFLLHGRQVGELPESFLSMGQPFWDYWLPHSFAARGLPLFSVEHPSVYHRNHPRRWSEPAWHRCALEFDRLTQELAPGHDRSLSGCMAMAVRVRELIERRRRCLPACPPPIREWVERRFRTATGAKIFCELGAHQGTDTAWLAALPGVVLHAFEPDPRNSLPPLRNVILNRAAISDVDGTSPFVLSTVGWGRTWTYSSSIKRPKNHLQRYPVSFGDSIEVATVALDSYCAQRGIDRIIDFIWADVQGAEGEMIRGARRTLARTRYLFTAYSDDEMYEGQVSLKQLLELLPGYRVVELWPDDVLLENTRPNCH